MKRTPFKRAQIERKPVPPYTLVREVKEAVQTFVAQPKDVAHRDRRLLDLAHKVTTCQNCDRHVESGCEPAHSNWMEHGKGKSRKASDFAHAALCHDCHSWLDQGWSDSPCGMYAPEYKREMWTRAHFRTFSHYWREGWIRTS